MAHNVQKPGVKIRHAPLIKGIEGDGKSMIGDLLRSIIGWVNVKSVSPKALGTDFTSFAEGSCVVLLEEIKLTGHNRYDILNALKPYVTNSSVPVHRKGIDEYEVVNTTNYMAFTNFSDALPLSDTDRRWFIVFTPWTCIGDLAAKVGDTAAYFARLAVASEAHRAELRRFFLDYELASAFDPNAPSPMTAEKGVMVAMTRSDEEDVVAELIEEGGHGIAPACLSSACLTLALSLSGHSIRLETSAVARVLAKIGFQKYPRTVKWQGRTHRVWTKGIASPEPDEVRRLLDVTIV
jgi:hypothetical protein